MRHNDPPAKDHFRRGIALYLYHKIKGRGREKTTVVYADSLAISELAADFMLLLATDRLCAVNAGWKRLLLGAAAGAAYSLLCLFGGDFWSMAAMKLVSAALMLLAAFGRREGFLRRAAVFALSAAIFAGISAAVALCGVGAGAKRQLFCFSVAYALLGTVLRFRGAGGGSVKVILKNGGERVELTALMDSGSSLRDPVSGAPALIAAEERLAPLLNENARSALKRTKGLPPEKRLELMWSDGAGHGFRLLPYSAVGVQHGMLLAFRPESATVGGKELRGLLAAMTPDEVTGSGFSAIINCDV